jgi:outer membrane protein OmpA-like peptidoglycan-associated protein
MKTLRIGLLVAVAILAGCTMMRPKHTATPVPMPPKTFIVFFHPWDNSLTPEAKVIVDQASAKVKETNPSTIAVAGYTDNDGSVQDNWKLARQRVKTVRDAMAADGIDSKLFLDLPLGTPDDTAGMTGDRRIEIRLNYGN